LPKESKDTFCSSRKGEGRGERTMFYLQEGALLVDLRGSGAHSRQKGGSFKFWETERERKKVGGFR